MNNPYKKSRHEQDIDRKRIHRPWEAANAARAHDDQQPRVPEKRFYQNHPPPVAAPKAISNARPSPANQHHEATDDFDCGIDWDAALIILEDQSVFEVAPARTTTTGPKAATVAAAAAHPMPPINVNVQKNNAPISLEKSTPQSFEVSSLNRTGPPKENRDGNKMNSQSIGNALAGLRPPTWNSSRNAPASSTTSETCDPDQQGLPLQLQFTKKDVSPVRDEYQKDLVKHAAINESLLNGWTLYGHQKRAILKALAMRRCILALDMGLGKTLIGCVWAKAFVKTMETHVIVLCPVSLQEEWKRSMEKATGLVVQDLSGTTKKKKSAENSSPTSTASPSVSIHSWSKIPTLVEETYGDFIVIADEAHSIQSMQSARTKDTLKLISSPLCEGALMLTGTPMKNGKPSNLFPLLKAVNHPLGRHQKAYEAHFCAGRELNFGRGRVWQANGATNLDQLHKLTKSHMLHLTKEACLKDLPPLSRIFVQVPVSSRRQMQHNHALQELAKIYQNKSSGPDDKILGAVQKVRMMGSLAKVEAAVEKAKAILLNQPALVIFTSFQEVARQVHRQLGEAGWKGEILTGETPAKKRQAMVDNFQKGLSPIFCCTFGAGGVGLTLTAAHSVLLVDRPWTPGDAHQAEDRVRRIGQTMPVTSIWLRAFGIDKQIDEMIVQKSQTANAVLTQQDPSSNNNGEQQGPPRISIFQMLKSVLPATQDGMTQTSILQFSQQEEY